MEEGSLVDSTLQENNDDVVPSLSRILDELYRSYSQHADFIPSVVFCIRELIKRGSSTDRGQIVIKKAVDQLAGFFSNKALWVQLQILDAIRRLKATELTILLANAFRNLKNGVAIPVRLLLQDRLPEFPNIEMNLPSYAMAVGENSSFNLGVPSDGPIWEARKVPLEAVIKVSMSANHALFLTRKGEVFACGATVNFDTGEDNGKLVVSPIQVRFPGEALPIVDIAAGPHHSVFISRKIVYVCGVNNNFCLGLKKDRCHYSMTGLRLPIPTGSNNIQLKEVFTNAECTIIRSSGNHFRHMWIVGKTPYKVAETFRLVDKKRENYYAMIRTNVARFGINNKLAVLYSSAEPSVFPTNFAQVNYPNRGLKEVKVAIVNNSGTLNYTFDPDTLPIEPCVVSVNGFLIDIYCIDYLVTIKGDVFLLGYPFRCRTTFCTLFRGKVSVLEDKVVDDGFIEAYSKETKISGLRVLLLLQEVPGAHTATSFTCSPDGKNLIYITNSSTSYRSKLWKTADYKRLNESRCLEGLDELDLNFHIYNEDDECWSTLEIAIRARFPNVDKYIKEGNSIHLSDLVKDVDNALCAQIFFDYLIRNENRVVKCGLFTKSTVQNVCRVLGVPCIVQDMFYQIGEPLQCLEDFIVCHNCILVSDEGVEIKFIREILELQSTYFTVALSYHNSGDMPRLQLFSSTKLIRCALLGIINQNYFRSLEINEFVELLQFLDQYLLHAAIADALSVIFERVNEFNVGFVFDLYEVVPQVRLLIAEYLFENLHLIAFWKNSASAPIGLLRDVFACAEWGTERRSFHPYFPLGPPYLYILGEHRDVYWSQFCTEDVLDILIGTGVRNTTLELAVRRFLQDGKSKCGKFRQDRKAQCDNSVDDHFSDSQGPELVITIRKKLMERDQASISRRERRKTNPKSGSVTDVKRVEECTKCDDLTSTMPTTSHEDGPGDGQKTTVEALENVSSLAKDFYETLATTSSDVVSHKKQTPRRFTSKGEKFCDASSLLRDKQSATHFAPWAGISASNASSDVLSMSVILQEEMEKCTKEANSVTSPTSEDSRTSQARRISVMSWNSEILASSASPPVPSLVQIMDEEERRLRQSSSHVSSPLQFVQDEERAINELTQLYRETFGDEFIVCVERCATSNDIVEHSPVWANTPRFRAKPFN